MCMEYQMSKLFNSLNMTSSDDDDNYYDDFDTVDDFLIDYLLSEQEKNDKCSGSKVAKSCAGKPSTKQTSCDNPSKSCDPGPTKSNSDGLSCKNCGNFYPFSEPNQEDGTLICYSCRNFG
jgi:hypothetical protein